MAGIGFQLAKTAREGGVGGIVGAAAFGAVISAGPWLITAPNAAAPTIPPTPPSRAVFANWKPMPAITLPAYAVGYMKKSFAVRTWWPVSAIEKSAADPLSVLPSTSVNSFPPIIW